MDHSCLVSSNDDVKTAEVDRICNTITLNNHPKCLINNFSLHKNNKTTVPFSKHVVLPYVLVKGCKRTFVACFT